MGGFDKKMGVSSGNWKRGAGQKGGITIIKGGLVISLETMDGVEDGGSFDIGGIEEDDDGDDDNEDPDEDTYSLSQVVCYII